MMTEIGEIDWSDIASAFPAFVTIIVFAPSKRMTRQA